ncbi:MAG TPA: ankyrin repeat domain-containing protein [Vicinamibacterales bacterium]
MDARRQAGWWIAAAVAVCVCGLGAASDDAPLVDAVKQSDIERVSSLIAAGADVNAAMPDGTTALHIAAYFDELRIASLLIDRGASVKVVNRYGVAPLSLAASTGDAALVEKLLTAGADPNTALPAGETALMAAARAGGVDAAKLLLARGARVNATENWKGQTALMWAAARDHAAVVQALVAAGADVRARSKGGFSAFLFAARGGHIDAAKALLGAGADVNETAPDGTSALVVAVVNGHFELAKNLLEAGADPNADKQGWTALHQISWVRRPNTGQNSPGPVPDGTVSSLDLIRELAAYGADLDARETKEPKDSYRSAMNRIGATPFLLAAKAVDLDMMRVLVELGADPLLATEDGTTPLMVAGGVGIYAVGDSPGTADEADRAVAMCLELGGDATAVDANGETALHGAALRGANGAVKLLVDAGARLDLKNKKGWTPLRIADGVSYNGTTKRMLHTAALLREIMTERGVPIDESLSSGGVGYAKPKIRK